MSVASTNRDIIQIKQQLKNIATSGSGYASIGHTHSWLEITGKPTAFAPDAHNHLWSQITDKPAAFTPEAHNHSWTEITGKPATFAPEAHTHLWAHITDKPNSFTPVAHSHSITDISDLTAQLASKQKTMVAGQGISFNDNGPNVTITASSGTQWTSGTGLIHYNGKVGVKNTNPGYDLDVSGDINLTGTLYYSGLPGYLVRKSIVFINEIAGYGSTTYAVGGLGLGLGLHSFYLHGISSQDSFAAGTLVVYTEGATDKLKINTHMANFFTVSHNASGQMLIVNDKNLAVTPYLKLCRLSSYSGNLF